MNELLHQSDITMDSREIAELLGARHADIMISIETQLPRVGYTAIPYTYRNDQNGQTYRYYKLPYRETMILVSGYSVELRARIIDRWLELEREAAPKIPKTYGQALRLAADQALEIEKQAEALALAAPKIAFADAIDSTTSGIPMGDFAHILAGKGWDIGRIRLSRALKENGLIYSEYLPGLKEMVLRPYQNRLEAGLFVVHEVPVKMMDSIYPQILITPKGQRFILDHLPLWGFAQADRKAS